jgi:uncharacterized RDD family membrane protein YckC
LLIDGIVVGAMTIPARIVVAVGPRHTESCTVGGLSGTCRVSDGSVVALAVLLYLAALVAGFAYYAILDGRTQTLGRRATGIRVLDASSGTPIGVGRALGRSLFRLVSGLACWLGFLWMLWDPKKQTWHDKVVSSVVVRASAVPAGAAQPTYAPPPPPSPWS